MVHSITAPLSQLAATAQEIAGGALGLTADIRQDDEIGALARTFNHMTARLGQAHDQLEQRTEELTRANAELQAENSVRRQAEQAILQHNRELAILSRRLVEIQESERHYISRELHDETGQALTSLMLRLGLLERDLQRGLPVKDQAAEELGLSVRTVESHREHIMAKLGLHSRVELVRYAAARRLSGLPK